RLDGSFDFPGVDIPTRGYSDVKVLILDRSSGTLLETVDYSRRGGEALVGKNQYSLYATLGERGNVLDDRYDTRGTAMAVQGRYGLGENFTVEFGHQSAGASSGTEIAGSIAFAKHWFGSLAYAQGEDTEAVELDLEGGNEIWSLDLNARQYRANERDGSGSQWLRSLNYRYQASDSLNLGLYGRDASTHHEQQQFVLPTVRWSDKQHLSASAWPNQNGHYRIDGRYTPTREATLRYTYEEDRHFLDYRHSTGASIEYYGNARSGDNLDPRYELGMIWYSENSLFARAQVGLVANGGKMGYSIDWDSQLLPGIYSRLKLSQNAYGTSQLDNEDMGLVLQWDLTLDFAFSRSRLIPTDSLSGSPTSAAISGPLLLGDAKIPSTLKIDKLAVIVDGDSHTATVRNGYYYLDGLKPGLHQVTLDAQYLPIELVPKPGQAFWVRLESAATTDVPMVLEARYAVAGKVLTSYGERMANEMLIILDSDGKTVGRVYSDNYGYYRADNLPPGNYLIEVKRDGQRVAAREMTITDDFLFEQDLVVPLNLHNPEQSTL
ncbi:MAG: carboxypeptidase regulatory-like domain-containing protein, partial [Halieaceae bacterium]|nr:carboxypeptidase regulatory-like domain-containing protein [Halieaceae bacterium]